MSSFIFNWCLLRTKKLIYRLAWARKDVAIDTDKWLRLIWRLYFTCFYHAKWKCTNCGHIEYVEKEVLCWKCDRGEMIYIANPKQKETK